jgi:hypothetical protein
MNTGRPFAAGQQGARRPGIEIVRRSIAQAIVVELADYSQQSLDQGSAALNKLLAAKTIDTAVALHGEYMRTAYQDFVARTAKLGEIYTELAKDTYRPFERYLATASR